MGTQSTAIIELRALAWGWAQESEAITAAAQTVHPLVRQLGTVAVTREIGLTLGAWSARAWPHWGADIFAGGLLLRACPKVDPDELKRWVDQGRANAGTPQATSPPVHSRTRVGT